MRLEEERRGMEGKETPAATNTINCVLNHSAWPFFAVSFAALRRR